MKALVTGASRGIGRAITKILLAESAQVAVAVRDLASAVDLAGAIPLQADLQNKAETESLIARAIAALGGLDVLVHSAGIVRYRALPEVTRTELQDQLEINFIAPFLLSQSAATHMSQNGGGTIIHIASTLALRPAPQTAAYAATKAALLSLTRSLALEFGPQGIRANAVAPGLIDTDMLRTQRDPNISVDTQLKNLAQLPLLKRLGTPEDIAEAVLFLIKTPHINGTILAADGGILLT